MRRRRTRVAYWVARNQNGDLYLYHGVKPVKYTQYGYWYCLEGKKCLLDLKMSNIKWEDEEPFRINFRY